MRLDKLLSENTSYSRSEIKLLIKKGQAKVFGEIIKKPDIQVDFSDDIELCGKKVNTSEFIYIKMNKPKGVLTATRDKRETVLDLIPPELKRKKLFPVGRLDKNTTGLLIITNDGELAHNLLSPKKHISKTYEADLDGAMPENLEQEFLNGVTLQDGTKLKPAKLEKLDETKALITVTEGKYHQIKRMFGVFGLGVNELKRLSFAEVKLDNSLKEGECKLLTNYELSMLKNAKKLTF